MPDVGCCGLTNWLRSAKRSCPQICFDSPTTPDAGQSCWGDDRSPRPVRRGPRPHLPYARRHPGPVAPTRRRGSGPTPAARVVPDRRRRPRRRPCHPPRRPTELPHGSGPERPVATTMGRAAHPVARTQPPQRPSTGARRHAHVHALRTPVPQGLRCGRSDQPCPERRRQVHHGGVLRRHPRLGPALRSVEPRRPDPRAAALSRTPPATTDPHPVEPTPAPRVWSGSAWSPATSR